jgi:hypothetical protein
MSVFLNPISMDGDVAIKPAVICRPVLMDGNRYVRNHLEKTAFYRICTEKNLLFLHFLAYHLITEKILIYYKCLYAFC